GVCLHSFYIKIRVWCDKVKNVLLPVTKPIFPADVPSFDEYRIKSMLRCEVNDVFCLFSSRAMASVRRKLREIITQFDVYFRTIRPCTLASNKVLPPNSKVLHRLNPGYVFISS